MVAPRPLAVDPLDLVIPDPAPRITAVASACGRFAISQSLPGRPWIVIERDPRFRYPQQVASIPDGRDFDPVVELAAFLRRRDEARREGGMK